MGEVRVQDERGNIHVFPDGSTPEMIAKAMNVKPPAASVAAPSAPVSAAPPSPEGFWSSALAPFTGAVKGIGALLDPRTNDYEKEHGLTSRFDAALSPLERLVTPQVQQGEQAVSELKQANAQSPWYSMHPSPAAVEHRELALGHGLASVLPMVGPWAAQVGQAEGEQLGTGNYTGAAGTALGNAALAFTPKAVGKAWAATPEAARSVVRRLAGSGPGVARELVRQAAEDNRKTNLHNADRVADAQQLWRDKQAKANTDHQAELLRLRQKYAQDTRAAAEKARTGTDADRAAYQSKQLAAKQKYDQGVREQTEKFQTERAGAEKANAEAQRTYNQKIGETARHNRAVTAAERAKADQAAHLQVGGSQLIRGLNQIDRALRDRAGQMYDAVREKVGGITRPGTALASAAQTALQSIKGTSEVPKVFKDILTKGEDAAVMKPGDPWRYSPTGKPATPVTFSDLQGYYSELGAELSKGTLPGDVYMATRALQDSIGDMMQDIAKEGKVNNQFIDARKFYREYMDTFHGPTGPSSSGSPVAQALLAKDPLTAVDKFAGDSGDRGIANLRRYSDSLANLAQDVRRRAQANISVPARKAVADIPAAKTKRVPTGANLSLPPIQESAPTPRAAALPLPPVLPDVEAVPYRAPKLAPTRTISADDIQRANEVSVQHRGSSAVGSLIRLSVVWPAFHMLSDLMRGREVGTGGVAAIPAAGATGMAIEEILSHPDVKEFLTRPSRQQVAQIPMDLRGQMPQIVAAAKARGVPVSPLLAAYAATIQQNQRQQSNQSNQPNQGAPQ